MKSLRIVHCANFSESKNGAVYYSIDRKLSNGLIKNGHFVYDFSYREIARCSNIFKSKRYGIKHTNKALKKVIDNVEPNLLLLGHSELITSQTLQDIKKAYPQIKIAMWWVDPFNKIEHIYERLDILDAFFATTGTSYLKNIFKSNEDKLYFLPNPCDKSIENIKSYDKKNYKYDLIYTGREDDNRKDFIKKLKTLKDIKIAIFGNNKRNLIFGYNYYKTISNSKLGLNYSRYNDIDMYSSDRVIQLVSSGICTISPKIPNFDKLFSEEEIVYFDDFNDFREKVYYYLKNDNERVKIAKKGKKKAFENFDSSNITNYLIETIYEKKYSKIYCWI